MEKINIANLLKDCPTGMELDCAIFNDVTLYRIDTSSENEYPIRIETKNGNFLDLTKYGTYSNVEDAKCVIFPKGKTTWEGFVPPYEFKDGDIISNGRYVAIFHKIDNTENCVNPNMIYYHCWYNNKNTYNKFKAKIDFGIGLIEEYKYATEKEKEKLFQAIKDYGYKWNEKTKTLEKLLTPKFKVGDIVMSKINQYKYTIADINKDGYKIYYNGSDKLEYHVLFCNENDFTLVSNKFNISTLKPFESKVLVRDNVDEIWFPCFFGGLSDNNDYPYRIIGGEIWKYCIPYEGNEHLLNKRDDCDEYYKIHQ